MNLLRGVPRAPLALGLAGLLPFAWGAASSLSPALADWGRAALGPRFAGGYVAVFYGSVILSFMSGVLWGFATRAGRGAWGFYAVSVLPALWAFVAVGGGSAQAARALMAGFAGLLLLDFAFQRAGLAPRWWMRLRLVLTAGVLVCLAAVAWG